MKFVKESFIVKNKLQLAIVDKRIPKELLYYNVYCMDTYFL